VLGPPVVVDEDGGRADVAVDADGGVADVGQVGHLAALTDLAGLDLDERPGLAAGPEAGAGAQVGEGPDLRLRTDHRAGGVRADHAGALAHLAVGQGGVRAEDRPGGDARAAVQLAARPELDVLTELDVDVDPGAGGVDDGDAGALVLLDEPVAQQPCGLRQLDPVVDAHRLAGDVGDGRGDAEPGRAVQADDVGEVLLALRVVGRQAPERLGEARGVEGVDARGDLAHRAGRLVGVLVLDHRGDGALRVAHDPSVAVGSSSTAVSSVVAAPARRGAARAPAAWRS
jgi:hypothetical protein